MKTTPSMIPFAWAGLFRGHWARRADDPAVTAGDWPPFAVTAAGERANDRDVAARVLGATGGFVAEAFA